MRPRPLRVPLPLAHSRRSSCDLPAAGRIQHLLRLQHRLGDSAIGAAATEISAHAFAHALGLVAGLSLLDQTDGAHDLAGRTEAALQAVVSKKRLLHRMPANPARHAFDRDSAPSWLIASARQELSRRPSTMTV